MADFLKAYNITIAVEGGYSDNPNDNGGATYRGVSRVYFPNWEGWKLVDAGKSVPEEMMKSFYKINFWDKQQLDILSHQHMANKLFDCSVNMSPEISSQFFQRCINSLNLDHYKRMVFQPLKVDGIVGRLTIGAFHMLEPEREDACVKLFTCLRGNRYLLIEEADPTKKEFMLGWINRL